MLVLCAGDLHLGRRSSRLPDTADPGLLACARAWHALVDHAIARQVDLVALSGDLVDRANRFFEAVTPLRAGVERLARAGIPTVAVTGNHDHDVLPRLARLLPRDDFRLLGADGAWERWTLERGGARLHVDGWSFPAEHVRRSPLDAYPRTAGDGTPVLGLLHADLDAPASAYAPVSSAALHACDVALWLLGHVHAPALRAPTHGAPVLYPGSPQAMDPGETGAHGAWEVTLVPGQPAAPRFVPLSSVRYGALDVDVTGVATPTDVWTEVVTAVTRAGTAFVAEQGSALRWASLRVRLTGRTPLDAALRGGVGAPPPEDLACPIGDAHAVVERLEIATQPALDLAALAAGVGAPAAVAALVLAARRTASGDGGPVAGALGAVLAAAGRGVAVVQGAPAHVPLRDEPLATDDATLAGLVEREGLRLLDALLAQRVAA